jgi:PPOX class probable F420-dependent enzyme
LWTDESFLVFSQPNQAKVANIARSGRVSVNFEATEDEEQITIFTGTAKIVDYASLPREVFDRYADKYADGMERIELPREQYEKTYTVAIRITPQKVRGW